MTNPPPPQNWGPPQSGPQPPYGQQPQYGPGQWPPQQGWPPQPPPKNNGVKWLLVSVAILLVIAISVGATILFTRGDTDASMPSTTSGNSPAASDLASANDDEPVAIITDDPTCEPWRPINDTLVDIEREGWASRDYSTPASSWTAEERAMHERIAAAMRDSADQMVHLARLTPHRVMRELYEQTIAYRRAYADSIPTYTLADNSYVVTASNTAGAITAICAAVGNRSASTRGPLVPAAEDSTDDHSLGDPESPQVFMPPPPNSVCPRWTQLMREFEDGTALWRELDSSLPASSWTPEQRSVVDATGERMREFADQITIMARDSDNAVLRDFGMLATQYFKAYIAAIPSYTSGDSFLSSTALHAALTVFNACAAAVER